MADKTVSIRFKGRDDTRGAFNSVNNNLRGLSSSLGNLRGPMTAISGIAAGLGLTKVFADAVEATREYERSTLKLEAVMKATGGTVGFTNEQLEKSVRAMERDTIFAQNEIRDATSIMMTFKSVQGETFTQGIELAADMAAVMDQSLKSSVVQLGKALEDPVRGLSALREVGVSFTAQQEEMIKSLVESGDKMKAQGIILEALEGQFGGTAGKMNEGLHGAIQSTGEAWNRLLVEMGKTPAATVAIEGSLISLTTLIDGMAEALERFNRGIFDGPLGPGGKLQEPLEFEYPQPGLTDIDGTPIEGRPKRENRAEMEARSKAASAQLDAQIAADQERREVEAEERRKAMAKEEKKRAEIAQILYRAKNEGFEFAYQQQEKADRAAQKAHEEEIKRVNEEMKIQREFQKALEDHAARREEQEAREREAMIQRTLNVLSGLNTEREALVIHTKARLEVLQEARDEELITEENYQWQKERLREQHAKRMIAIEDEETRKKWGINTVYRKLDLESSQYFMGQMSMMMESGNRHMFEVGKAAAIGETIIQTYRAAMGSYAALASIPFVGPALGAAAAAAAVVAGIARVEAIRSTEFGAGSVATPTFNANPVTGLPTDFGPQSSITEVGEAPQATQEPRIVNITLQGESGMVSTSWVRDHLIPSINEAVGDGAKVMVN